MRKRKAAELMEILVMALALLLLLPAISFADEGSSSREQLLEASEPKDSPITGSFSITRSNSLYIVNGNTSIASWDFAGTLAKEFANKLSVTAILEGSQELKAVEDSDLSRGRLIFSKGDYGVLGERLKLTPKLTLRPPVSRAENSASFQGSVALSLAAAANADHLPSKKLSLGASASLSRSFHKYETAVSGKVNTQYGSVQTLTLGWAFTDNLSLSAEFNHINAINYQGRLTEAYAHVQEIAYSLNPNVAVAVGHQYGAPQASVLRPDEQSLNYNLTDDDNSIGYGTLTLSF